MTLETPDPGRPERPTVSVRRLGDTPVVATGGVPGYGPIFNAGVIVKDDVFHLFARGVRDGYVRNPGRGPRFLDYVSDVLVFTSSDGRDYRSSRCSRRDSQRRQLLRGPARAAGAGERRREDRDDVHQPAAARVWQAVANRRSPARVRRRALLPQPRLGPRDRPRRDA